MGPGRGSAAGSMVAYCLAITDVDPIKYSLLFRALSEPGAGHHAGYRHGLLHPPAAGGHRLRSRKYGADHVAQIVTFGTMAARAAIRDVGRALNITYAEVDAVAKLVPNGAAHHPGRGAELSKQLRSSMRGRAGPPAHRHRPALEGMPRHASTHAAGVVITQRPVYEYVPLAKNDESVVTQYTMTTLEELGLLKMDFLGLRNLTVLDDAVKLVQKHRRLSLVEYVPEDDPAVFEMLSEGKTAACSRWSQPA